MLHIQQEKPQDFTAAGVTATVVYNKVTAGNNIDVTVATTVAGLTLSANHDSNADGTTDERRFCIKSVSWS